MDHLRSRRRSRELKQTQTLRDFSSFTLPKNIHCLPPVKTPQAPLELNIYPMFSVFLLVYFFYVPSLVAPFPVYRTTSIFEHLERGLPTCECPDSQRTVWGIVWSCLATIFTCTWVSVHPNIPDPHDSQLKVLKRRAGLMVWTIIAPELVIFWAIRQWIGAQQLKHKFRKFGWTKTHGYFVQMGGFTLYDGGTQKQVLSGYTLEELFCAGKITFPMITEEEIQDRSKGDGLTKGIAILQTTWFVLQCITRHIQGLAITELEVITFAFATLNGLLYIFWWNKPLDVRYSIPVILLQEPQAHQTLDATENKTSVIPKKFPKTVYYFLTTHWQSWALDFNVLRTWQFQWSWSAILAFPMELVCNGLVGPVGEFCGEDRFKKIPDSRRYTRYAEIIDSHIFGYKLGIWVVIIGNAFGAIHFFAWTSSFPSDTERIIWRICCIILLSMPEVLLLIFSVADLELYKYIPGSLRSNLKTPSLLLATVSIPIYGIARITLIIEAFVTLRALPPAALAEIEWASLIPHI